MRKTIVILISFIAMTTLTGCLECDGPDGTWCHSPVDDNVATIQRDEYFAEQQRNADMDIDMMKGKLTY